MHIIYHVRYDTYQLAVPECSTVYKVLENTGTLHDTKYAS